MSKTASKKTDELAVRVLGPAGAVTLVFVGLDDRGLIGEGLCLPTDPIL